MKKILASGLLILLILGIFLAFRTISPKSSLDGRNGGFFGGDGESGADDNSNSIIINSKQ